MASPRARMQGRPVAMARWLVLRALDDCGGAVTDKSGQAGGHLGRALGYGHTRSAGALLAKLEEEGIATRDINGRRCYRIALTPKGVALAAEVPADVPHFVPLETKAGVRPAVPLEPFALDDEAPALVIVDPPAVEVEAADDAPDLAAFVDDVAHAAALDLDAADDTPVFRHDPDVTRLAEALLTLVVRRASAEPPTAEVERTRRDIDVARQRLASTLDENQRLRRRVEAASDDNEALRVEVRGLRMRVGRLESNLDAAIKAAAQGVAVDERTLRDLERLLREVPRFPARAG